MSVSEFNMSTDKVSELGGTVGDLATKYINKIDELTSLVNGLTDVWGGPTYDAFKAAYDAKLGALEELNTVLRDMSNQINATAEEGEAMISDIEGKME